VQLLAASDAGLPLFVMKLVLFEKSGLIWNDNQRWHIVK
jgi:hypothetical protein